MSRVFRMCQCPWHLKRPAGSPPTKTANQPPAKRQPPLTQVTTTPSCTPVLDRLPSPSCSVPFPYWKYFVGPEWLLSSSTCLAPCNRGSSTGLFSPSPAIQQMSPPCPEPLHLHIPVRRCPLAHPKPAITHFARKPRDL